MDTLCLGALLIGACQEILGDLHNLHDDTNAVLVSLNGNGEIILDTMIEGNTVRDVETALREGRIGYTYLEDAHER